MSTRQSLSRVTRCAQSYRTFHATVAARETPLQRQTEVKQQSEELTGSAKLLAEALEAEAEEARNPKRRRRFVVDRAVDDSP